MGRSIVNQGLYLQRETTPGTAVTNAMRRYLGIKGRVGYEVEKERFRASGYKIDTANNVLTEMGTADIEVIQDYNAMLPLLSGAFGAPVTTALPLPAVGDVQAYEHVFTLNPRAADARATFTAIWGDASRALQVTNWAFNALTIGVQRNELSLSSSAILRAPTTGATVPTAGVTEVPQIPVRASTCNVYLDTTWANLGTTKLQALYSTEIGFGAKYSPDWVVNSELPSFSELLENGDADFTQSLQVGFDATAQSLIDAALQGGKRFVRVACTGPLINSADRYSLRVDTSVDLTPTDVGESVIGNSVAVNFDGTLEVDATSGQVARARLVNALSGL
jgi:hypothetical protein